MTGGVEQGLTKCAVARPVALELGRRIFLMRSGASAKEGGGEANSADGWEITAMFPFSRGKYLLTSITMHGDQREKEHFLLKCAANTKAARETVQRRKFKEEREKKSPDKFRKSSRFDFP